MFLNEHDATSCEFIASKQIGFYRSSERNIWPVVQPTSEPCEFEFVPRKSVPCEIWWDRSGTTLRNLKRRFIARQYRMLVNRRIVRRLNRKQDTTKNTKKYDTFRYHNKFKDEDFSIKKRIAKILERSQSSHQYCNVTQIARLAA